MTGWLYTYNHMVMNQVSPSQPDINLDAIFSALADKTRRGILARLIDGEASVAELTELYEISQPAISKHLKVLERADLIERTADKQRRLSRLNAAPMAAAVSWLEQYKQFWEGSFDQLDTLLADMKQSENKG